MNQIQIKDINLGGIADSLYQGQANSVAEIVGFDIHSEPGILKNNQKMIRDDGGIVDDFIKAVVVCSDGYTYFFGSTAGKIWARSSSGTWTFPAQVATLSGFNGVLDAYEYQGYIYYATKNNLCRCPVAAPTIWGARDDGWKTFANGDASFHPMGEVNQVLYIGDGKDLDQVDAGVYTASALDIYTPYRIKSLGRLLTDILIGTFINTYRVTADIFRWNTWSESWSVADDVPEIGVNSFLRTDNFVLASVGTKGSIYQYNGSQLDNFKRIPGNWAGANEATIHPNASCNWFGLPLFGVSNVSGNPATQGVYSLGGYDRNYPKVLNLEWLVSNGATTGVEIGSINLSGTTLLVSYKQTNSVGTTVYMVDRLDTSAKVLSAYFTTREVNIARNDSKTLSGYVGYRSLPTSSSIKVYYKTNYSSSWTEATTVVDTIRKTVYLKEALPEANTIQIKVESNAGTTTHVNEAPEIEIAEFQFE